jgi:hypothetical protein
MSGPRPDMSEKSLWKSAFQPDLPGSEDLTRVKAERPDMSGLGPNMSMKPLWSLGKGSDKSSGPNLFWNRSNRSDRCAILVLHVG